MKYKFTFKKAPRSTGVAAVGDGTPHTEVKYRGECVGLLYTDDSWSGAHTGRWYMRLKFDSRIDGNCPWRWGKLKVSFTNEEEARQFVQTNALELYSMMARVYKDR